MEIGILFSKKPNNQIAFDDQSNDQILIDDLETLLDNLGSRIESDSTKLEDIAEEFRQENISYLETAGNDDGNDDHPTTYSGGEHVQGCDRGEELVRINEFFSSTVQFHQSEVDNLSHKLTDAKTQEELECLKDEIENLVSSYDQSNHLVDEFDRHRIKSLVVDYNEEHFYDEDEESSLFDCESCGGTGYDSQDDGQCEDCYGTGDSREAD